VIQRLRHRSHTGVRVACDMPIRLPADPQMLQGNSGTRPATLADRPGPPGQRQRDRFQRAAQLRCAVLMPLRHGRHLPGEGPQLTSRVAAEEPAYLKVDHHGPAARRQVMNPPPAPTVDPGRRHTAPTAGRIRRPGPGRDQHGVPGVLDLVDLQAVQMREEQMQTAGFLACQAMVHNDPRGRSLMISSWSNMIFTKRPHPWSPCYAIAITMVHPSG
jgi:hypothetical protein